MYCILYTGALGESQSYGNMHVNFWTQIVDLSQVQLFHKYLQQVSIIVTTSPILMSYVVVFLRI